MADKMENEMQVVDNIDYLRGLKGNNSVLLPLSKLIEQYKIISYKSFIENDDLNDYKGNGVYGHSATNIMQSILNKPAGSIGEAILLVLSCSENYGFQMYFNVTDNSAHIRFRNSNIWSSWKQVSII